MPQYELLKPLRYVSKIEFHLLLLYNLYDFVSILFSIHLKILGSKKDIYIIDEQRL